ncbi:AAA family ATPase [Frederiksenia canicola]
MKLESIEVVGLFNKKEKIEYHFHNDLTILTGKNGSGKTTIMKLAWFIISGNIPLALREIDFLKCIVKTSEYKCYITKTSKEQAEIIIEKDGVKILGKDGISNLSTKNKFLFESIEDQARDLITRYGGSIFFPTFRRIEGGFSLNKQDDFVSRSIQRASSDFDDSLSSLSRRLTNRQHHFVSAISSRDINNLLLRKYTDYSEEVNMYNQQVSSEAISRISSFENNSDLSETKLTAEQLLSETKEKIEKISEFRQKTMAPITAVKNLIERLFNHSGIYFGRSLSFGDAAEAIYSEQLSAGEKQMLSFICYNAFYDNFIVFIDEPELSLHIDWQRQLYTILKSQNKNNQFIFATHSPFIYGKYPDKEIVINNDKGFCEE